MDPKALLQQARDLYTKLTFAKRMILVGATLAVLGAVLAIGTVGSHETYAYLFTDLSTEDAAAVTAKLKELKVPFRLDASGTAVEVPEEQVHQLRLDLAGSGLPRGGGVGFEIFDKARLGSTEFEQRVNLRRALEGELSRTIGTIGSVQNARVHLVLPEHTVFVATKEEASASVIVKLRSGRTFDKAEVASVVHLVASAVPGLSEDRVSVVSADGMTLHRPRSGGSGEAASGGGSNDREEQEREVSGYLEEHARTLLERVVGPGHVDVRVSVTLDESRRERTEEHYDPARTALRSEQKSEEKNSLEGLSVSGVPGAESNLPTTASAIASVAAAVGIDGGVAATVPAAATQPQANGGSGTRASYTRNWEVDRVAEKTMLPPGSVAHLSIAVLLDGKPLNNGIAPREKPELDQLASLTKEAVGFDGKRGDTIQVDSVPFAAQLAAIDAAAMAVPPSQTAAKRPVWQYAAAAGAALLLLMALVMGVRSRSAKRAILALEAAEENALALPSSEGTTAALLAAQTETPESVRERALEISSQDPATAAMILREWLSAPSINQPPPAQF